MHFEYPNWTGDSGTPADPPDSPPPHRRARSNSFTYRNPSREPNSDENYTRYVPRADSHPAPPPPRMEQYFFNMRDYARMYDMPTFYMPPYPPFMYGGVRMSPEQVYHERMRAYEYGRERHHWWERPSWMPPSEWARHAEWVRREAAKRYERRYFAWRNAVDDNDGARHYSQWARGQSRTEQGNGDEWSWYRRSQAPPRDRGPYMNPHPHSHSHPYANPHFHSYPHSHPYYEQPRFSHQRAPSDAASSSTGTSTSTGASSSDAYFETTLRNAFAAYDATWGVLPDDSTPLTFHTIPWPQHPPPRSVDDLDARAIRAFLGAGTRTLKAHTREALLRFHPDKITALLARVEPAGERELVAAACSTVTRCLGEVLKG